MKNVLIWDIENISFSKRNEILEIIPENTIKYIVSKRGLKESKKTQLESLGFEIFSADFHDTADEKIVAILNIIALNTQELYIVSNDTDFLRPIDKIKENFQKVHYILTQSSMRGILMGSNLTDKKHKYHILVEKEKKEVKKQKPLKKWSSKEKAEIEAKREIRDQIKKQIFSQPKESINKTNLKNFLRGEYSSGKKKVKIDGQTFQYTLEEWIEAQTERTYKRYLEDFSTEGICHICHEEALIGKTDCLDIYFCQKCEREWIGYQEELKSFYGRDVYKSMSHEKRFIKFFEEKDIEYKINGFSLFKYQEIDSVKRAIGQLQIPSCYLED